jgi:hypothetical protein
MVYQPSRVPGLPSRQPQRAARARRDLAREEVDGTRRPEPDDREADEMIQIELPWWDQTTRSFGGPVKAWIVPDLAPHFEGTFAVHRFPIEAPWPNTWLITHVETGCGVGTWHIGKQATIAAVRDYCATKTAAEFQRALRKVRRLQKGK